MPAVLLLALFAAEAAAGGVILGAAGRAGPALLAALGNLLASLQFGVTLRPGQEPLISRYSRYDSAARSGRLERYTRRLTASWALLLACFALAFLGAACGAWSAGLVSRLQLVLCPALFVGEHWLRRRCFPELGRVTLLRTCRAIWLSHMRVPHAL
ncbi:hypothetical protein [Siccirubricoccus phaeus]|uniref:hypothetical protein n=1 Tax=Siccirubricoccus phaeus TaxID=2595053 RepID=UPI0011F3ECD6|nr:hypothetical protein [Siccirubricoccus phaeus]